MIFGFCGQDLKNIEAGLYKLPWDMTTPGNKQYDPVHVMRIAVAFASEASNTLQRRMRGSPDRVWLDSPMYPEYYLNTFHYQVTVTQHHMLVPALVVTDIISICCCQMAQSMYTQL